MSHQSSFAWPKALVPPWARVAARFIDETLVLDSADTSYAHVQNAVRKRQREFLTGRACAQDVLETLGFENASVGVNPDRSPIWPPRIIGSITHNNEIAAAMAAFDVNARGIGIDVEKILPIDDAWRLMKRIASDEEVKCLNNEMNLAEKFALLFSSKEAIYKSVFPTVKRFVGFDEAQCVAQTKKAVLFRLSSRLVDELFCQKELEVSYLLDGRKVMTYCSLRHL